jgi:hypothetical protein
LLAHRFNKVLKQWIFEGSDGLTAKAQSNCGHLFAFQGTDLVASLVQNISVSTSPDHSIPPDRKLVAKPATDFSLDPLPVPEATESSTDTAWGLWEHTLRSFEEEAQQPEEPKQPGFEDTEVSGLIPPREEP